MSRRFVRLNSVAQTDASRPLLRNSAFMARSGSICLITLGLAYSPQVIVATLEDEAFHHTRTVVAISLDNSDGVAGHPVIADANARDRPVISATVEATGDRAGPIASSPRY